jgi:effector-binding domain-containing protein
MDDQGPRLETREAQPTVAIRHAIPRSRLDLGEAYGTTLPRVFAALGERGLTPAGPRFGRYLVWSAERVVVEIGVPVAEPVVDLPSAPPDGELRRSELPAGPVAVLVHVGPYEGLPAANGTLARWIEERGLERAEALWESYLDDPDDTPHDQVRTAIIQPVRAATD